MRRPGSRSSASCSGTYKVFNTEQADGLAVPEFATAATTGHDPITECETVIAGYLADGGPRVSHGHELAAYSQATDVLVMPSRSAFGAAEEYYSTYFHAPSGGSDARSSRLPPIAASWTGGTRETADCH